MTYQAEEFLEHFGVKGMRWGIRKNRPTQSLEEKQARRTNLKKKVIRTSAGMAAGTVAVGVGYLIARQIMKSNNARKNVKEAKAFFEKSNAEYERVMRTSESVMKTASQTKMKDIFDLGGSGGLTPQQAQAVEAAYDRWSRPPGR